MLICVSWRSLVWILRFIGTANYRINRSSNWNNADALINETDIRYDSCWGDSGVQWFLNNITCCMVQWIRNVSDIYIYIYISLYGLLFKLFRVCYCSRRQKHCQYHAYWDSFRNWSKSSPKYTVISCQSSFSWRNRIESTLVIWTTGPCIDVIIGLFTDTPCVIRCLNRYPQFIPIIKEHQYAYSIPNVSP